jgi:ferredoxin
VDAVADLGVAAGDFASARQLGYPDGRFVTRFPIAAEVAGADAVVGLPKLKTHGLTRITGALKNNLGCVHGLAKARYHLVCPDARDFSDLLVDLTNLVKPRVYIADGVIAMEGNGPRGGDPARVGVILASADPVALDATFCRLVEMDPANVPTNVAGEKAGLGAFRADGVEVVGDELSELRRPSFRVVRRGVNGHDVAKNLPFLKRLLTDRPVIDPDRCVRCGACVEACPVPEKAVRFNGADRREPPRYDYGLCIRCYCCQEMCPYRAIELQTPLVGRLLGSGERKR